MFLSDAKRQIIQALRKESLDPYQIAADTQLAPFLVRAELKALRRDRLVVDHIRERGVMWELTARGHALVNAQDQLGLEGLTPLYRRFGGNTDVA